VAVSARAEAYLVEAPVIQALEENGGIGPLRFLLSDNGSQYVGGAHDELLAKHEIVHKRIPACRPEYNGSVECGGKEFKQVFYSIWYDKKQTITGWGSLRCGGNRTGDESRDSATLPEWSHGLGYSKG